MRLIPLLLCWMSGSALAGSMPALVVSPDLVRDGAAAGAVRKPQGARPAPADAASPASQTVEPQASEAQGSAPGLAPAPAARGVEVRPVSPDAAPARAEPVPQPAAATSPVRPAAVPAPASDAEQPGPVAEDGSTAVTALRIRGTRAVELVAEGEAELQRGDLTLTADSLTYRELTDEAIAEGNVRLAQGTDELTGPSARIVIGERTGEFESPRYSFSRTTEPELGEAPRVITGSGGADELRFEGENQYRLSNATWSSCSPQDPDWYVKARDLELDYDSEVGTLRHGTLVFKDVPIVWVPWAEFPLVGRRQSGLLAPSVGTSNKTGLDITQPYYWNIAPNYDATLWPRYMSRRGLQLGGEVRYLNPTYKGELRAEWLGKDKVAGIERRLGSWVHEHQLTDDLKASIDLNAVSDDKYFEDLSSRVSVAATSKLLRRGKIEYEGSDWWSAAAVWQRYQTLSGDEPYRKLPQLSFKAGRSDLIGGLEWSFGAQYVNFDHPDARRVTGTRTILTPTVGLPFERPGYFIIPRAKLHHTEYRLDRPLGDTRPTSITRSVPILSLDSGLVLERDSEIFGRGVTQTLEPRVFYVRAPSRDQSDIPVFDTARYDLSFAQLFSESAYSGGDRVADANQVTVALTSRFIDRETGVELLRAAIGQRRYFSEQEVALPGEPLRTDRRTDVLAALSGRFTQHTYLNSAWQYNPRESRTERFNFGVSWQPEFAKAVNLNYRWTRGVLRDLDMSAQWPLGGRWYGVGRVTRSILEGRVTEAMVGVEYDGGCWVFRTVGHRFLTTDGSPTQSLFFQLELNGLASIGSNPVGLLKRSVSGYGKINEPGSGRIFGTD